MQMTTSYSMSFKPNGNANSEKTVKKMENCAMEVREGLIENKMMNNNGKTLISLIGTPQQVKKVQIRQQPNIWIK